MGRTDRTIQKVLLMNSFCGYRIVKKHRNKGIYHGFSIESTDGNLFCGYRIVKKTVNNCLKKLFALLGWLRMVNAPFNAELRAPALSSRARFCLTRR